MTFKVGMKVVCVADGSQLCNRGDAPVCKGEIYTIRELFDWFGNDGVRLEEITNPYDRGYHLRRFRPVIEDRKRVSFQIGADPDPDSDRWDNRKKRKEKV